MEIGSKELWESNVSKSGRNLKNYLQSSLFNQTYVNEELYYIIDLN